MTVALSHTKGSDHVAGYYLWLAG